MTICHLIYIVIFIATYKEFGEQFREDEGDLTMIGSIGGLMLGAGKLFGATLLDYVRFRNVYFVFALVILVQLLTLYTAVKNVKYYLISCSIVMACEGLLTSMLPVLSLNIFGLRRGPQVFGILGTYGVSVSLIMMLFIKYV